MNIVFLLYEGMTALDMIGPHEVLCHLPGAVVKRVAERAGAIETDSSGLLLTAEQSITEVTEADILVIPGAGNATTLQSSPQILKWISQIHQTTQWTASVCTGSLILGAAGLLAGCHATSHWAAIDRLSRWGAMPTYERVVIDGKMITAAGVSAGIDMALLLAAKLSSQAVAERLQLALEYDPAPPFQAGSPEKTDPGIVEALRARLISSFEP